MTNHHRFPRVHNAMWPGLVGKGPGSEPVIDLATMLRLTAEARVDGVGFDGVDLFLSEPHISIDSSAAALQSLAREIASHNLVIGSLVAPVWPATGGGSAMGSDEERAQFVTQVEKACRIGQILSDTGVRKGGVIRIDSAASPEAWIADPERNSQTIADTFHLAADVAENYGERLAAEGEVCWAGMHSWRKMVHLLEIVDRPDVLGFQADMAHTFLYALGANAPEDRLLPEPYQWDDPAPLDAALRTITDALRPWTIDFHVAQNDATLKGSGAHDQTGRHCLPDDPNGKMDIVHVAGMWLRDDEGHLTKRIEHICWDGCMFPNSVMESPQTWQRILSTMLAVRQAHGWS
jgi:Xylose isomerase-like TIM barrel